MNYEIQFYPFHLSVYAQIIYLVRYAWFAKTEISFSKRAIHRFSVGVERPGKERKRAKEKKPKAVEMLKKYSFMNENVTRSTITKASGKKKMFTRFVRCVMLYIRGFFFLCANERPRSRILFHILCFEYRIGFRIAKCVWYNARAIAPFCSFFFLWYYSVEQHNICLKYVCATIIKMPFFLFFFLTKHSVVFRGSYLILATLDTNFYVKSFHVQLAFSLTRTLQMKTKVQLRWISLFK